jgi:hypothetical protein
MRRQRAGIWIFDLNEFVEEAPTCHVAADNEVWPEIGTKFKLRYCYKVLAAITKKEAGMVVQEG